MRGGLRKAPMRFESVGLRVRPADYRSAQVHSLARSDMQRPRQREHK